MSVYSYPTSSQHRPYGHPAPQPHPGHFLPRRPQETPPAVYVLVAMGLMAILAGLFGTCGTIAALAISRAEPVQAAIQPDSSP